MRDLTIEQRQQLQHNGGVFVFVFVFVFDLVNGSTAFMVGGMAGDFLVGFDHAPIGDRLSLQQVIASRAGQSVVFDVVRNGKPLQIAVNRAPAR